MMLVCVNIVVVPLFVEENGEKEVTEWDSIPRQIAGRKDFNSTVPIRINQ